MPCRWSELTSVVGRRRHEVRPTSTSLFYSSMLDAHVNNLQLYTSYLHLLIKIVLINH